MIGIRFHNAHRVKTLNHLIANHFLSHRLDVFDAFCKKINGWYQLTDGFVHPEYMPGGAQTWSGPC
jgi:hypothetical protein